MAEKTEAEKTAEAARTAEERRTKALENLTAAFTDLKGKVEKQAAPKEEGKKPTIYTRAQLRAAVNAGTITEDQMDETLERQLTDRLLAAGKTEITQTTETVARNTRLSQQIDTLADAHPELKDKTSDLFQKVAAKFNDLVTRASDPEAAKKDLATELTAIEFVVGGKKPTPRKRDLEATEETGGGGGGDGGSPPEEDAWAKGLSKGQKAHYEKQIGRGMYKSTSDPKLKKEIEFARPRMH